MNYASELYDFNFQDLKDELSIKLEETATLDLKLTYIHKLLDKIIEKQYASQKKLTSS